MESLNNGTANYTTIGNVGNYIYLSQNYENEELVAALIRGVSYSPYTIPTRIYQTLKAVRYAAGVLYPEWNYHYFDTRCYHADNDFNTLRLGTDEHKE